MVILRMLSWVWIFESELNKAYKCCWFFISTNFIANKNSLTRIIKITLLLSIKSVFAVINNLRLIIWSSHISVFYWILISILLLFKDNKIELISLILSFLTTENVLPSQTQYYEILIAELLCTNKAECYVIFRYGNSLCVQLFYR